MVDFLLELDASQCSQRLDLTVSQRSESIPSNPSSQKSNPLSQGNLSICCKEESGSSEDENEISIAMTQKVFYDTVPDQPHVEPSVTATAAVECTESDEDDFDEITASQLLQLDGNNDVEPSKVTTRKRKRLGGRPAYTTSSSSHSCTGSFSRVMRSSSRPEKNICKEQPPKACTRDLGSSIKPGKNKLSLSIKKKSMPADAIARFQPANKVPTSCTEKSPGDTKPSAYHSPIVAAKKLSGSSRKNKISDFINLTQRSPTVLKHNVSSVQNSPKLVTKLNLSQNSPDIDFSLTQFDDLKNSPKTSQEKRYRRLKMVSPDSTKSSKTVCKTI